MDLVTLLDTLITAIEIGAVTVFAVRFTRRKFWPQSALLVEPPDHLYIMFDEVLSEFNDPIYLAKDARSHKFLCQAATGQEMADKLRLIIGNRTTVFEKSDGTSYVVKL